MPQAQCGCHASTGICKCRKEIRSAAVPELEMYLFIFANTLRSRFRMNVACGECRGSSSLWFQRTFGRAASLRSRPFHRSFDMASWWVVGSHTNDQSGSTSTAALLALDFNGTIFIGYLPKRSASCRRGPLTRP
jgi:hypothetical protein